MDPDDDRLDTLSAQLEVVLDAQIPPPRDACDIRRRGQARRRTRTRARAVAGALAVLAAVVGIVVVADRDPEESIEVAEPPATIPGDGLAGPDGFPHGRLDQPTAWAVTFRHPYPNSKVDRDPGVRFDLTSLETMLIERLEGAGIEGATATLGACCDGELLTALHEAPEQVEVEVTVPGGVDADEVAWLLGSPGVLRAGSIVAAPGPCDDGGGLATEFGTDVAVREQLPPDPDGESDPLCLQGNPLGSPRPTAVREDGTIYAADDEPRDVEVVQDGTTWTLRTTLIGSGAYWANDAQRVCDLGLDENRGEPCPAFALDDAVFGVDGSRVTATWFTTPDLQAVTVELGGLTQRESELVAALLEAGGSWLETDVRFAGALTEPGVSGEDPSETPPSTESESDRSESMGDAALLECATIPYRPSALPEGLSGPTAASAEARLGDGVAVVEISRELTWGGPNGGFGMAVVPTRLLDAPTSTTVGGSTPPPLPGDQPLGTSEVAGRDAEWGLFGDATGQWYADLGPTDPTCDTVVRISAYGFSQEAFLQILEGLRPTEPAWCSDADGAPTELSQEELLTDPEILLAVVRDTTVDVVIDTNDGCPAGPVSTTDGHAVRHLVEDSR